MKCVFALVMLPIFLLGMLWAVIALSFVSGYELVIKQVQ